MKCIYFMRFHIWKVFKICLCVIRYRKSTIIKIISYLTIDIILISYMN